jgi:membrane fusion protein, multidrug efflux system
MDLATDKNPSPSGEGAPAAAPVRARRRGAKPFLILAAIVGLAILVWLGYGWLTRGKESTDNAQVDADVVPISARVGGSVLHTRVHDDQQVKQGDVLIEIDPADYQARVAQAEAEVAAATAQAATADAQVRIVEANSRGGLASAKAQVTTSSASVRTAVAQVGVARANLDRANTELAKAENDLGRAKRLRGDGAIPQIELDNAQAARDAAGAAVAQMKAQVAAAEEQLQAAQSRVTEMQGHLEQSTPIEEQLASARAQAELAHARVLGAQAALTLAKLQLSYTTVVAPSSGTISRLGVHEGQLIQPAQLVVELVPGTSYVIANFKETQVAEMRAGQRVDVEIDAFPHRTFAGKVESISRATGARFSMLPPDNASGNFVKVVQRVPVKIVWDQPPGDVNLAAGLSAEVTVHVR